MSTTNILGKVVAVAALPLLMASCIDEDMSLCDYGYRIDYNVRLHTNMDEEIDSELTSSAEQAIGEKLRAALSNVFTDHAADLDLSFFSSTGLAHHEVQTVNATTAPLTIFLPVQQYRHLALANTGAEPLVAIGGTDAVGSLAINQEVADTIGSHTTGLFSARLPMSVEERSQTFTAELYMQNCASALVIDRNGKQPEDIQAFVAGMATGFAVSDSTYSFERSTVSRASQFADGNYYVLHTTTFPSRDKLTTKASTDDALWSVNVVVKLNGSYTLTVLKMNDPLKAGNLKIIKARIRDDGSVNPETTDIGVSVQLNWQPGNDFHIDI